jgi:hypothetical protein
MQSIHGAVLAASLTLGACSTQNESMETGPRNFEAEWLNPTDIPVSEEIQKEDTSFIDLALSEAQKIADQTQNPLALELMTFAEQFGEPSYITTLGPLAIASTYEMGDIFFVSIGQDDIGKHPISDYYLGMVANGVYTRDLNTLFLYSDDSLSGEWLGILMLHELNHAKNRKEGIDDLVEEARTREFHHELSKQVFGTTYMTLLEKAKDDMRDQFRISLESQGQIPFMLADVDTTLITDSASVRQYRFILSTIQINAIFELLDDFGMSSLEEKQAMYDSLIQQLSAM